MRSGLGLASWLILATAATLAPPAQAGELDKEYGPKSVAVVARVNPATDLAVTTKLAGEPTRHAAPSELDRETPTQANRGGFGHGGFGGGYGHGGFGGGYGGFGRSYGGYGGYGRGYGGFGG